MITSSARLTMRFAAAVAVVDDLLGRAVCQTGKDIAEATRQNMYPGHFMDSGLSEETTTWEQTDRLGGRVHIPTAYAAYPELGTVRMAPRPALTPAVMEHWPGRMHENWAIAETLPPADTPGPEGPAIDKDGNPL